MVHGINSIGSPQTKRTARQSSIHPAGGGAVLAMVLVLPSAHATSRRSSSSCRSVVRPIPGSASPLCRRSRQRALPQPAALDDRGPGGAVIPLPSHLAAAAGRRGEGGLLSRMGMGSRVELVDDEAER